VNEVSEPELDDSLDLGFKQHRKHHEILRTTRNSAELIRGRILRISTPAAGACHRTLPDQPVAELHDFSMGIEAVRHKPKAAAIAGCLHSRPGKSRHMAFTRGVNRSEAAGRPCKSRAGLAACW